MAAPHLAPFVDAGPLVFLSGQVAFDTDGVISGDVRSQTQRCLERMEVVLKEAGLALTHVAKCTIWLRHEADFAAFNEVYAAYFGNHRPARSTVVSGLALPEALVEIEAIASRSFS